MNTFCANHACKDNSALLLYQPEKKVVYGTIYEKGKTTYIGNPPAASAAALGLAWAGRSFAAQDSSGVRLAQIGFNGQGTGHIGHNHRNLVALCDVDSKVLHNMADKLKAKHNYKLDTYTDFRKLLERKDIDAVSIATPNHTHAMIAVAAAQAGKHVYVEKPVSHNIWEGRQMIQAARQNNRLMQCGTQSRPQQARG